MSKIARCPFCGGEGRFMAINCLLFAVKCQGGCGAEGPAIKLPSYCSKGNLLPRIKAKAIAAWNRRAGP